jgi:hypothetical protein
LEIRERNMERQTVIREYPYCYSVALLVLILFLVSLLGIGAKEALDEAIGDEPFYFHAIKLEGTAAKVAQWVGVTLLGPATVVVFILLIGMVRARKQRIAFTDQGIILPRHRYSTREELVEYSTISDIALVRYPDTTPKDDLILFLEFTSPRGRFSIARGRLKEEDFSEIITFLHERVQEAKSHDPLTPGPR